MERLRGVIADALGVPVAAVRPEMSRGEDENWDSLGHLRLVTSLEQTYGVQLTMREIEDCSTVSALAAALRAHGVELRPD